MGIHQTTGDLPMPTAERAKEVFADSRDEIAMARNTAARQVLRLHEAVNALFDAFEDGRFAEIKQAGEAIREAGLLLGITGHQVEAVADGLVNGCIHQLNRRPRP